MPTANRYSVLMQDDDGRYEQRRKNINDCNVDIGEESENSEDGRPAKKVHIPPIVITRAISDYASTIKQLQGYTSTKKVTVAVVKEGLSVRCETVEDYKMLKTELDKTGVTYYTHEFRGQKSKNLVLKGLPNLPLTDIYNELQELEAGCIKVALLKTHKTGEQSAKSDNHRVYHPSFLVVFQANADIKKIRNIRYICSVKVYWEKFRNTRRATQCRRCQRFGHGTSYCKNKPRCVKCVGEHLTNMCDKPKDMTVQCINCGGPHPANYSKCEAYIKHLEKIDSFKNKTRHQVETRTRQEPPIKTRQNFPELKTTYSKTHTTQGASKNVWKETREEVLTTTGAAKHNEQTTSIDAQQREHRRIEEFCELTDEIKKLNRLCNIGRMLSIVRSLNTKLSLCKNDLEMIEVFSKIICDGSD